MRILLTGHSLGGVVAILAAHDLATQLGLKDIQVRPAMRQPFYSRAVAGGTFAVPFGGHAVQA